MVSREYEVWRDRSVASCTVSRAQAAEVDIESTSVW